MKWITREYVQGRFALACPVAHQEIRRQRMPSSSSFRPTRSWTRRSVSGATYPYDCEGRRELGHHGKECSFEAILKKYNLTSDPALVLLGRIVKWRPTTRQYALSPAGRSPGSMPSAEGFRHLGFKDDHAVQLPPSGFVYDAAPMPTCQKMVP